MVLDFIHAVLVVRGAVLVVLVSILVVLSVVLDFLGAILERGAFAARLFFLHLLLPVKHTAPCDL